MDRIIRGDQGSGQVGNSDGNRDGGLEQFPKDWGVSGMGELETCLPSTYQELVRTRLSEVSEKAKTLWNKAPLGESAEVKSVRAFHHWTVARITVKEQRSVEVAIRPYNNEILPKVTVESPDEVNPYSYDLFAGDQDEGEESLEVVGSAQVVSCDKCNRGKVSCDECHGAGKVSCEKCEGDGRLECPECVGGKVQGARGKKNCPRCKGIGDVDCPDCRDGIAKCPSCGGKGASLCPECKGHSRVIRFIRVKGKRVRIAEAEEVFSPSLSPMISLVNMAKVSVEMTPDEVISLSDVKHWISDDCDLAEESRFTPEIVAQLLECRELVRVEEKRLRNVGLSNILNINMFIDNLALAIHSSFNSFGFELDGQDILGASGHGYPLNLSDEVAISRLDSLSVSLGEEGCPEDDAMFAAVILTRTSKEKNTVFGRVASGPDDKLVAIWEKLVQSAPSISSGERIVRDYVRLFVRSWIGADYSNDGKGYFAFIGKQGVYSQGASPVIDAATLLVEEAREQLVSKVPNVEIVVDNVQRALSNLRIWPDSEALALLLTQLPKAKFSSRNKFRVLDVVNGRFDAMDAKRNAFLKIWTTPEKDEFDDDEDCQRKRDVEKELFIDWVHKVDTGRVNRNLVNAVRDQIESAKAMKTFLIVAGLLVAAIFAFVAFLSFSPVPESESTPVPEPTLLKTPPPAVVPVASPPSPDTDCGNASVPTPVGVSADRWSLYRCMGESEAEARWGLCLSRGKYTKTAGRGCPGEDKCCPPK